MRSTVPIEYQLEKWKYSYWRKETRFYAIEEQVFSVIGMQNKGKGVKIANYPGLKNKVVKPSKVVSVQKRGGLCYAS